MDISRGSRDRLIMARLDGAGDVCLLRAWLFLAVPTPTFLFSSVPPYSSSRRPERARISLQLLSTALRGLEWPDLTEGPATPRSPTRNGGAQDFLPLSGKS